MPRRSCVTTEATAVRANCLGIGRLYRHARCLWREAELIQSGCYGRIMLGLDQARIIAAVAVVCSLAAVLAGCGGAAVPSTKNAESRLAASFDAIQCDGRAISSQTEQKERANFRSLVRADLKLPRVARLVSDAHAEDKLKAAIRKAAEAPGYKPGALKNDFTVVYRLRGKFYADEKALGFRCAAPPQKPREG